MKTFVILILAFTTFVAGGVAGEKKKAPDLNLKTVDGKVVSLTQLRGKVVIVNFWATWCGPCRREIPDFMDVYTTHRAKGLEIVGVAVDNEGWKVVTPYVEQRKINYPIVVGGQEDAFKWGSIQYIPTTFIVDKEGFIVDTHTGLLSRDLLLKKIAPLL